MAHGQPPLYSSAELIADLAFALDLSDRAATAVLGRPEPVAAR
jgi:hypothetical protein